MKNKIFLLLILITTISLMVVALYNGFPLVEGDTGAYIQQAIYPHFAADRPPFYGLFIRITSLWTSLWYPVFAQCLILSFLLLKFIRTIRVPLPKSNSGPSPSGAETSANEFLLSLVIVTTIVSFTCVAWVSAYLMADIFTGILLLAVILYLTGSPTDPKSQGLYLIIIFGAIAMHNSHLPITGLFSFILLISAWIKKNKRIAARSLALIGVCTLVWATMCSMNAAKKFGFTFSRGSDIFLVAKLAENGILRIYLDDNCGKKNLKLCKYARELPSDMSEFLWDQRSPLYVMGGWDSCRAEYGTIAHDVLTTPRYFTMLARKSIISTLRQITQVHVPDNVRPQGANSQPWLKVRQYFADELSEYNHSAQCTNALSGASCNFIYYLFFIMSSLWMLGFYRQAPSKELAFIYGCILLFFVINACVTSTFSQVNQRFQYRVFWILPATNAIVIIKYYWEKLST